MLGVQVLCPRRAVKQLTSAVGAALVQPIGTFRTKGAFEAADHRQAFRRQILVAALAIRPKLQRHDPVLSEWVRER